MKKTLKRSLSLFLAIAIIFSSAYAGLNELDFSGLFTIKANAADVSALTFSLDDNGDAYSVESCDSSASGEITIPNTYNGLPVISVLPLAFMECTNLTAINVDESNAYLSSENGVLFNKDKTLLIQYPAGKQDLAYSIPDGVTIIESSAFRDNANLTSITIPDSVIFLRNFTFYKCTSLKSVVFGDGLRSISGSSFSSCTSLEEITIPEGVKSIEHGAFDGCTSLKSITIPNSVTSIGSFVFNDCTSLESIVIPEDVTAIEDATFQCCTNLKSVTLPSTITSIGGYAFNSCENLESINIPHGVSSIGVNTFLYCRSLKSITIPSTVVSIDVDGFYLCDSLKDIYYDGSQADWDRISKEYNEYNPVDHFANATFHFGTHVHTYGDWVIDTEFTCTQGGLKHRACTECGNVVTKTGGIREHKYTDEKTIDVPVTCTENGSESYHCLFCDHKKDVTVIEAKGHNFVWDVCQNCDSSDVWSVRAGVLETAIVKYIGDKTEVYVPQAAAGNRVKTICSGAFSDNPTITYIQLSHFVTTIEDDAFSNSPSLRKVIVPESVTEISDNAFADFSGVIYCIKGSYAHQYAVDKGIPFTFWCPMDDESLLLDTSNRLLYTNMEGCNDVYDVTSSLIEYSFSGITPSYLYGNYEFFGTGSTFSAYRDSQYLGNITLIVEGDLNGDSICDALDASLLANHKKADATLVGAYRTAADTNMDGALTVEDYQAVVNKAVS